VVGPAPTGSIVRPAGRRLAYDDVGDPGGAPLVYLHGFPDSRLSRHPDDGIAAALGVRLVAVDRPGFGASECDGAATYAQEAEDVVALADHLGLDRFSVVGWSSGAALALACGAVAPCRVAAVGVLAGNPPLEADANLGGAIDELYAARGKLVAELGARAFAEMVAPLAAPVGLDVPAALEYVREGRDATALADLDAVYACIASSRSERSSAWRPGSPARSRICTARCRGGASRSPMSPSPSSSGTAPTTPCSIRPWGDGSPTGCPTPPSWSSKADPTWACSPAGPRFSLGSPIH